MKVEVFVKISIAILFLIIAYGIGYSRSSGKDYEVACLQADFIHQMMDENPESKEAFYERYQDLDVYNTSYLKSIKEFEEYSWCY